MFYRIKDVLNNVGGEPFVKYTFNISLNPSPIFNISITSILATPYGWTRPKEKIFFSVSDRGKIHFRDAYGQISGRSLFKKRTTHIKVTL